MAGASKQAVEDFQRRLKNPDYVLKGCEKYYEEVGLDAVYSVTSRFIASLGRPPSVNDLAIASETLLLDWNKGFYVRKRKMKETLEDDLVAVLKKIRANLDTLTRETRLWLSYSPDWQTLENLYAALYDVDSIDWIGAAKMLHLLRPEVFVPWDNSIAAAYHRAHTHGSATSNPAKRDVDCYMMFLRYCSSILAHLSSTDSGELTRRHPSTLQFGVVVPLTKMLDECNFMRFTRRTIW